MSEEAFDRIEQHLNRLQTEVRTGLADVQSKIADVDRHMHVLHEDAMGAIRGISEHKLATHAEMTRGFAEIKELIARRVDPLELADRHLSGAGPKRRR
jgi:hypothetical protein